MQRRGGESFATGVEPPDICLPGAISSVPSTMSAVTPSIDGQEDEQDEADNQQDEGSGLVLPDFVEASGKVHMRAQLNLHQDASNGY